MTLMQKLSGLYHKRVLGPALSLAAAILPTTALADFYDGMRGPSKAQVHYTANFSGESTNHSLALKYFGDDLLAVGAGSTDGTQFTGSFAGIGYFAEQLERVKAVPVLGYALSGDGKQGTVKGIAQVTALLDERGAFMLDSRYAVLVPTHGQDSHKPQHSVGLTPSVGNTRFRIGPDISYTLDDKLTGGLLFRFDIDAVNHTSWAEFGLGTEGHVQLQFRGNF